MIALQTFRPVLRALALLLLLVQGVVGVGVAWAHAAESPQTTVAFDFTLSFSGPGGVSPGPAAMAAGAQPGALDPGGALTLFDALERQLGLKLEKRDISETVVVLDRVESKPTDN